MDDKVIQTKELTKKYGEQTVVNQVNLHVKKGRIYGLLGRNGAGKTTIMKMMLGLTAATSGSIELFGSPLWGNEKTIYPRIGAMIEHPGFYPNLTGTENLEIFAKLRGTASNHAVKHALELVGLPYKDKKTFGKYSLGMKQRLGIANAILHDPELLILDEPTNGLDPIGIAEMRNFMKNLSTQQGKTILISSHILSEIALLADDVGILDQGVLLEESSMEELKKRNAKYILLEVSDIPKTIALLADDVGILDQGVLLEESSMEELKKRNAKYILLEVSDIPKTLLILERNFQVQDYSVQDEHTLRIYDTSLNVGELNKSLVLNHITVISANFQVQEYSVQDEHTLRIYDTSLNVGELNKSLVLNHITVISAGLYNNTLEDYFKSITGGEYIA